jgi:type I restriction-modification system DNA methylase subunit
MNLITLIVSEVLYISGVSELSKSGNLITEKRAIGILTDCMIKIQKQMANLSAEDTAKLENVTGLLWTRKMDKDNYIEPQESKSLEYDVNRAASYIIVNQLLFYHLLQYHQPEKYQKPLKPISNIEDPALFKEYFNDIQQSSGEGDYKAVFGIDLLSILPKTKNMVEAINQVIELIVSSEIEQVNQDILGKIFHNMIPKEIRKRIAAYYTSNSAGQLLARFSIDKPESIVMDLTCGSGTLLVEAYHVKDKLYQEKFQELTPEKRHNQILKGLFGNDISVFAARLASINLTRQNLGVFTEAVNITVGDGLSIRPFENPDLANNKTKKKYHTYTLHGKDLWIEYPYADCILMNPPFSSKRGMSKATVAHINKKMAEYDLEKYVDGNMGLNAYFILHADQFLKEGGTMSMVISSATFNTIYARKILDFLKDKKYIIEYVFETLADKPVFSEDCDFKEYMIVLKKTKLGVSDSDVS